MPQTPKQKPKAELPETSSSEKDSWSEDQKERGYYYDDAYGYEDFKPDVIDDEEDEGLVGSSGSS